jgi:type IV secretory pathway VirB3-like protein
MFYFIYAVIMLLFFLIYNIMKKSDRKAEESFFPNDFTITQPKSYFWVGISCAVVFSVFTVLAVIFPDTAEWWIYVFFIACSFLGIFVAYHCKMNYINVSEDMITYNTILKKPQTFNFKDITKIKKQNNGIDVYCGEKRIFKLETNCVGYQLFIKRLEDKDLIDNISKLSRISHL